MNPARLLWASGETFIICLILTPIVRDVFRSYNVVDRPGRRKVHAYPIPRIGGVSIIVAWAWGLLLLRGAGSPFPLHWVRNILSGALIIFLVGLIDDFLNLKPLVKLMGQVAASAAAFASGIRIDNIAGHPLPVWVALPATVFWLLLTTNALNLIDGLDGLCGGIGFWAALAFFGAALINGDVTLAWTALPLAAALLAFLVFNFNPATVFLGDSGALLIGFLIGCFAVIWTGHRVTAVGAAFSLFALCVPLTDLGLSIIRRFLKNQPIFSADRGHIHHRLLDRGHSVRRAALTLYAVQITGAGFGLLLSYVVLGNPEGWHSWLPLLVLAAFAAVAVTGIRHLRYAEFEVAGELLFGGELRRVFAQRLRLRQLEATLERAGTVEQWWRSLAAAGAEEKWIQLNWICGAKTLREEVLDRRIPSWSFAIELAAGESILVQGDSQTGSGSADLIGFSRIVNQTLARVRQEREQSAVS
jgi:UDP-GlcNAc:undecaprenyl-phosphate GlcNAc-1-phosphate transferase